MDQVRFLSRSQCRQSNPSLVGPGILQSAQNQTSQGESDIADSSDPLFTMYNKMAEEEDKKMAKSWKADADGILVFVSPNNTRKHAAFRFDLTFT